MAVAIGDYEAILSGGVGASGGALPSFTEAMTAGFWTGLEVAAFTAKTIHYGIQVDISDNTSDTDADYGLYSGVFRWVTERPGYTDLNAPSGENEGDTWAENILTSRADIGQAIRMIDIITSGNYGTLSGFSFSIDNTSNFIHWIETNDYKLLNRKVKFYVILDDVFYTFWSGVISGFSFDELKLSFECEDDFLNIHKPLLKRALTKDQFPDIVEKSEGKLVPVSFGLVNDSELLLVSSKSKSEDILSFGGYIDKNAPIISASANSFVVLTGNKQYIAGQFANYWARLNPDNKVARIRTNNATVWNATYKCYSMEIETQVPFGLNGESGYLPAALYNPQPNTTINGGSWKKEVDFNYGKIEIFKGEELYIASDSQIKSYETEFNSNIYGVYAFSQNDNIYKNVSRAIDRVDLINSTYVNEDYKIKHPYLPLVKSTSEGSKYIDTITFPEINSIITERSSSNSTQSINEFTEPNADLSELIDRDYDTYKEMAFPAPLSSTTNISLSLDVDFQAIEGSQEIIKIIPMIDFSIEVENTSMGPDSNSTFTCNMQAAAVDVFGVMSKPEDGHVTANLFTSSVINELTPKDFKSTLPALYENGNYLPSEGYPSVLKLDMKDYFTINNGGIKSPKIRIMLNLVGTVASIHNLSLKVRQVGVMVKCRTVYNDLPIYAKINGEKFSSTVNTDSIYNTIRHILQNKDGINSSYIDYGDLQENRIGWKSGAQISTQVNSFDLLKEICRNSFTSIYPTRDGKRGIKCFRNQETYIKRYSTDNGSIIEGSIIKFDKSPIDQVYNEFEVRYGWSNAKKQYEKIISIKNADQSAFPTQFESTGTDTERTFTDISVLLREDGIIQINITGLTNSDVWGLYGTRISLLSTKGNAYFAEVIANTSTTLQAICIEHSLIVNDTITTGTLYSHSIPEQKWKTFVSGWNDYFTAKGLWEDARSAFLQVGVSQKAPSEISDCKFFINPIHFIGTSDDYDEGHKFTEVLVEWTTRQKYITEFETPISEDILNHELTDLILFNDVKYTNSLDKYGYITKIKINPDRHTVTLECCLLPYDIPLISEDVIIETGDSEEYTETGEETTDNEIIEGGE